MVYVDDLVNAVVSLERNLLVVAVHKLTQFINSVSLNYSIATGEAESQKAGVRDD